MWLTRLIDGLSDQDILERSLEKERKESIVKSRIAETKVGALRYFHLQSLIWQCNRKDFFSLQLLQILRCVCKVQKDCHWLIVDTLVRITKLREIDLRLQNAEMIATQWWSRVSMEVVSCRPKIRDRHIIRRFDVSASNYRIAYEFILANFNDESFFASLRISRFISTCAHTRYEREILYLEKDVESNR